MTNQDRLKQVFDETNEKLGGALRPLKSNSKVVGRDKELKELNYIKGLAILLVFIGHASTPSFLHRPYAYEFIVQLIYSFHMSLFFYLDSC